MPATLGWAREARALSSVACIESTTRIDEAVGGTLAWRGGHHAPGVMYTPLAWESMAMWGIIDELR